MTPARVFFKTKRFVFMMACLMAMTALGIDTVLPLFPNITAYYELPESEYNRIQLVVFVYMLGFALFQMPFGIIADAVGRKTPLLLGVGLFSLASLAVLFIQEFEYLLVARFIQGAGLAAPRVLTTTIIRDVVSGEAMSRLMSFVIMIFLAVPAIAPMVGQMIDWLMPWQGVFVLLMLLGGALCVWVRRDLPETLALEDKVPLNPKNIWQACATCLSALPTLICLFIISLLFATLMTYIGLSEQILQRSTYHLGEWFPIFFALIVLGMISASFLNARFVMRVGMKKMILLAFAILLIFDTAMFVSVLWCGGTIPLWLFIILMVGHFLGFGLAMPNLNAQILLPYKHIAGIASALVGSFTTVVGVLIARTLGGFYDGNLYVIGIGFISLTVLMCVACGYLYHRYPNGVTHTTDGV